MELQKRILLIDDEPAILCSLVAFLEDYDYHVYAADCAELAMTHLKKFNPHVAIVDIHLPGMDGGTFITRAHALLPSLRFIVHTGSDHFKLSSRLVNIGVRPEHVFVKPLADMDNLVQAIEILFNKNQGPASIKKKGKVISCKNH